MTAVPVLAVLGCGRAARTLARLWSEGGVFTIGGIANRSAASAAAAVDFIGAGTAAADVSRLGTADVYLLGTPDAALAAACDALATTGVLGPGRVVFHLSGALPSAVLASARAAGAAVAGIHPVKSFADPARSLASFAGTWCGMEGDAAALALLRPAAEAIGARPFAIDPARKSLYHAGSVFACNYLTALIETSLRVYQEAGIGRETACRILEPIVRGTVDNVFALGTRRALTGPIARGERAVVARQLEALEGWDAAVAALYRRLGAVALVLARAQGATAADALDDVEVVLRGPRAG